MAGSIFVSYRRDDSKHAAGRLVDRLEDEFGEGQLFLDVDNIELGLDFAQVIHERVAACDIMLVVIGPRWLTAADSDGRPRLSDPNDFVRIEVEAALKRNVRVIPVLVDGAEPPDADELPDSLAPLANRQATRLAHESFTSDANALTAALVRIVGKGLGRPTPAPSEQDGPFSRPSNGTEGAFRESEAPSQFLSDPPSSQPDQVQASAGRPAAPPDSATEATGGAETARGAGARRVDLLGWFAALSPLLIFLAIALVTESMGYMVNDIRRDGAQIWFIAAPAAVAAVLWYSRWRRSPRPSVVVIIVGLTALIVQVVWGANVLS